MEWVGEWVDGWQALINERGPLDLSGELVCWQKGNYHSAGT